MSGGCRWDGEDLVLAVRVQPGASCDEFAGLHDGAVKIRITAAPVDGKANKHLTRFLAAAFGVSPSAVSLISATSSRRKRFLIRGPRRLPAGVSAG